MQSMILEHLQSIPKEAWITAIAIIGLFGILSIIRKTVKLLITAVLLAIIVTNIGVFTNNLDTKYGLSVEDKVITAVVDGEPIRLDLDNVKNITATENENNTITLSLNTTDGASASLDIPKALYKAIDKVATESGITIEKKQ